MTTNPQIPPAIVALEKVTARTMDDERQELERKLREAEADRQEAISAALVQVAEFVGSLIPSVPPADLVPFIIWSEPLPMSTTCATIYLDIPEHALILIGVVIRHPDDFNWEINPNGIKFLQVDNNAYNGDDIGRALVAARRLWVRLNPPGDTDE